MEDFGGSGFNSVSVVMKKRRSATSRKPRLDSQLLLEVHDQSPPSSTPSSDSASKQSPDGSSGHDVSVRRKEFSLNSLVPKVSFISRNEGVSAPKRITKDDKLLAEFDEIYGKGSSRPESSGSNEQGRHAADLRRCSEGVLAPANWKNSSKARENSDVPSRCPDNHVGGGSSADSRILGQSGGTPNGSIENKLRKVKLKVGGVTRTIHAKSNLESGSEGGSSVKPPRPSDAPRHRPKLILQDNSDDDDDSPPEKKNALQGVPWKDFSGGNFSRAAKEHSQGRATEYIVSVKETEKARSLSTSGYVRKSRRVPKRRVLDGAFDDEDDDEIRYLERLKTSKISADRSVEHENGRVEGVKRLKTSKSSKRASYEEDVDFSLSRRSKEGRKRDSEDMDSVEEEELGSDVGSEDKRKKQKKESLDSLSDGRKEISLTTRQRALQSGKDGSGANGSSFVEFPNGLPPAPPRKKLSEVEQQLKKAEAAQRRRLQVEKAAKESEAEAIRKILGQDSSKKKREEKLRKKREELAQERAAKSMTLDPNTVRWVMGPTGTTVIFPESEGLPSIFQSKPCSYPPPREKCAGPSCTNTYKYRDSKTNLPLCSLQCYRAVQQSVQPVTTC